MAAGVFFSRKMFLKQYDLFGHEVVVGALLFIKYISCFLLRKIGCEQAIAFLTTALLEKKLLSAGLLLDNLKEYLVTWKLGILPGAIGTLGDL